MSALMQYGPNAKGVRWEEVGVSWQAPSGGRKTTAFLNLATSASGSSCEAGSSSPPDEAAPNPLFPLQLPLPLPIPRTRRTRTVSGSKTEDHIMRSKSGTAHSTTSTSLPALVDASCE